MPFQSNCHNNKLNIFILYIFCQKPLQNDEWVIFNIIERCADYHATTFLDLILLNGHLKHMCKQNNTMQGVVTQPYIFSSVQTPVTHGYAGLSHAVSSPPVSGPPASIPTKAC